MGLIDSPTSLQQAPSLPETHPLTEGAQALASPDTVLRLAHSGASPGDAAAVRQFLGDHPEQREQLQASALAAGNFSLFHQLSQPNATATGANAALAGAGAPVSAASAPGASPAPSPQPDPQPTLTSKAREIGFAIRHPFIASDIGEFKSGSTNITTDAVRFATIGAPGTPGSVLQESKTNEGSQVNAFRHALWQATIAGKYGNSIAAQVGAAHEENPLVDLNQRSFTNTANADQTIDLLNNQIGRSIAAQNPGATMKELAGKALEVFHSDGLYTVTSTTSTTASGVDIGKTRISDAQYVEMKALIANVDNDGKVR